MFKKLTRMFMNSLVQTWTCRGFPHLVILRSRSSRVKATTFGSLVWNLFLKHLAASLALRILKEKQIHIGSGVYFFTDLLIEWDIRSVKRVTGSRVYQSLNIWILIHILLLCIPCWQWLY